MRIRKAHFRWDANLFSLFGLPVFAYLLCARDSFIGRGKVSWKGRMYDGEASTTQEQPPIQKAAKTRDHSTARLRP